MSEKQYEASYADIINPEELQETDVYNYVEDVDQQPTRNYSMRIPFVNTSFDLHQSDELQEKNNSDTNLIRYTHNIITNSIKWEC